MCSALLFVETTAPKRQRKLLGTGCATRAHMRAHVVAAFFKIHNGALACVPSGHQVGPSQVADSHGPRTSWEVATSEPKLPPLACSFVLSPRGLWCVRACIHTYIQTYIQVYTWGYDVSRSQFQLHLSNLELPRVYGWPVHC